MEQNKTFAQMQEEIYTQVLVFRAAKDFDERSIAWDKLKLLLEERRKRGFKKYPGMDGFEGGELL
jgi:hypothetical protein